MDTHVEFCTASNFDLNDIEEVAIALPVIGAFVTFMGHFNHNHSLHQQ